MSRDWAIYYFFSLCLVKVLCSDDLLMTTIESFEKKAKIADDLDREGTKSQKEIYIYYDRMTKDVENIINLLNSDPTNVYKFLESGGIETVINSQLTIYHLELRTQLLILMKKLFEMAPTTTNALMPLNAVDKIVDVFEGDTDEGIKSRALDILYDWLPNNPKIQARVMKMKGLEPFYEQALKLDNHSISTLLDLFDKILEEHFQARNQKKYRNAADVSKLNIYRKIGLIERLSNPAMCNGLLNIFEATWNFRLQNENIIVPVYKIMKKVKNYCYPVFRGLKKAIQVFENFSEILKEKDKEGFFEGKMNTTEFNIMLQTYIEKLKTMQKDEL